MQNMELDFPNESGDICARRERRGSSGAAAGHGATVAPWCEW